ncbi:hypothetical protein Efla_007223 [Eimeria flavescens]
MEEGLLKQLEALIQVVGALDASLEGAARAAATAAARLQRVNEASATTAACCIARHNKCHMCLKQLTTLLAEQGMYHLAKHEACMHALNRQLPKTYAALDSQKRGVASLEKASDVSWRSQVSAKGPCSASVASEANCVSLPAKATTTPIHEATYCHPPFPFSAGALKEVRSQSLACCNELLSLLQSKQASALSQMPADAATTRAKIFSRCAGTSQGKQCHGSKLAAAAGINKACTTEPLRAASAALQIPPAATQDTAHFSKAHCMKREFPALWGASIVAKLLQHAAHLAKQLPAFLRPRDTASPASVDVARNFLLWAAVKWIDDVANAQEQSTAQLQAVSTLKQISLGCCATTFSNISTKGEPAPDLPFGVLPHPILLERQRQQVLWPAHVRSLNHGEQQHKMSTRDSGVATIAQRIHGLQQEILLQEELRHCQKLLKGLQTLFRTSAGVLRRERAKMLPPNCSYTSRRSHELCAASAHVFRLAAFLLEKKRRPLCGIWIQTDLFES